MSDRGNRQRRPPRGLRYVVYAGLGLVVLVMLALSASVFLSGTGPAGPNYPGVTFGFEYSPDDATLRVYHDEGKRLTANNTDSLDVRINGSTSARIPLPVDEDDGVVIRGVEPGSRVEVFWHGPEGASIRVGRATVGGNATADGTTEGAIL
jgi:hypothetical protein